MTRLLLALLALLTGLAGQLNTAQARACAAAETEIGAFAVVRAVQPCATSAATIAVPIGRRTPSMEDGRRLTTIAALVPAVLQGIDRARE